MNIAPIALSMLLLAGCVSRPGAVSLSIVRATAQREEGVVSVYCDAILDNRTGEPLVVSSYFFSAFDGLSLEVYDDRHGFLFQDSFVTGQSPYALDRHFTLYPGRTTHRMPFTLWPFPNAPDTLRLRLVGTLPGSDYTGVVVSQVYRVKVKSAERYDPDT